MTEIFDSNNPLKERDKHITEGSYNCRLQDMNSSSSAQNKPDPDVALLVACKVQLSSEVVRWKSESMRLQKERDTAQHRTKELDQTVSKLIERTKELEMRLNQAEDENKLLKTRSMLDDQRASCLQRVTQNLNRCHSIPTLSNAKESSASKLLRYYRIPDPVRHPEPLQEDVWERTEKMMEQLHLEMKQLQQMNAHMNNSQNNRTEDKVIKHESNSESDCREELEESISSVTSVTESLKHCLLQQQRKLHSLIKNFEEIYPKNSSLNGNRNPEAPRINSPRPLDTTPGQKPFQDYYSEQLEDLSNLQHRVNHTSFMNEGEDVTLHPYNCYDNSTLPCGEIELAEEAEDKSDQVVEERVCPICQKQFGSNVPQIKFEEHVLNHLEAESASLLDQYEIL